MDHKIYNTIIALLLLLPFSAAYQQAYLVFELPGWEVFDQNSGSQSFVKGDSLYLDIKASQSRLIDPKDFAESIGGTAGSTAKFGEVEETVIANDEIFYIFARLPYRDHAYLLTMYGPLARLSEGKAEMQKLYASLNFAATPSVVEAPYEKEPVPPEGLSFLTTHPIQWDWIIFWIIILGIAYLIYRKVAKKRRKHREEHHTHKK